MVVPELLELARTGDPEAIAAILHQALNDYQIRVHLDRPSAHLEVYLRSDHSPNYAQTFPSVQQTLTTLNCPWITTVTVSGVIRGEADPQWHDQFTLVPDQALPPIVPIQDVLGATEAIVLNLLDAFPENAPIVGTVSGADSQTTEHLSAPSSSDIIPDPTYYPMPDLYQTNWSKIFHRPETVALVAFAIAVLLWDAYIGIMGGGKQRPVSASKLARRLGVDVKVLAANKQQPNFSEWSQGLDPDHKAWVYRYGMFLPLQ